MGLWSRPGLPSSPTAGPGESCCRFFFGVGLASSEEPVTRPWLPGRASPPRRASSAGEQAHPCEGSTCPAGAHHGHRAHPLCAQQTPRTACGSQQTGRTRLRYQTIKTHFARPKGGKATLKSYRVGQLSQIELTGLGDLGRGPSAGTVAARRLPVQRPPVSAGLVPKREPDWDRVTLVGQPPCVTWQRAGVTDIARATTVHQPPTESFCYCHCPVTQPWWQRSLPLRR